MAEAMFQLTKGRRKLPAGNIAATMILAGQLSRSGRRRIKNKPGASGGRKWSKALHPGLWHTDESTDPELSVHLNAGGTADPKTNRTEPMVGVVAIR